MQINSNIIYALSGSLVTLLLVFIFKLAFLSNELVPNTILTNETICETPEAQNEYSAVEEKQNATKPVERKKEKVAALETDTKRRSERCDEKCLQESLKELVLGKNLGADEGISFSSARSNQIAEILKNDPSKLAEIEATLTTLKDQDARDTILYVFGRLPDDQVQQVARKLSLSQNPRDRVDSLSLLSSVSGGNIDVQNEIKQIVSTENDPDILLKAIKISHSLSPDTVDSTVQNRLSNLINSAENEQIRSAALITKTRIVQGDPTLQQDISNALKSPSQRFTEAGIQALDNVLNKQKRDSNQGSWKSNIELQKSIENIANDPSANPSTRVEALNLIRRHYHKR